MYNYLRKMNKILIGIPCYNNSEILYDLLDDMIPFQKLNSFHFFFVDDGSKDNTSKILKKYKVESYFNPINLGYGNSVKIIKKYSIENEFDYCVIFPGDYQRSFKDINKLVNTIIKTGDDVVSGSKFHIYVDKRGPVGRMIGNRIFTFIASTLWRSPIRDVLSGFKIYKVEAIKSFYNILPNRYSYDIIFSYFASKNNLNISEISVDCKYNNHTTKMKSILINAGLMIKDILYYIYKY